MGVAGRTRVKPALDEPNVLNLEHKVQRMVRVTESNAKDWYP